ncbi:hypothetical protein [Vibrio cortegadensis]|uniref:ATP-binding protein n=1 Tax=Vibrio cortegadensis TaxID=1328770 RepID=A0ABV4M3T2_9VIBR
MRKHLQLADRANAKRVAHGRSQNNNHIFRGKGSIDTFNTRKLDTLFGVPIFPAPSDLDLSGSGFTNELKVFFEELEALLSTNNHIYLSFEHTSNAKLPMFLLIVALQEKHGSKITPILSRSSWVNKLIEATGSFISATQRKKAMFDNNVSRIPIISGSNLEFENLADDLVDAISAKYYDNEIPPHIEARISQAIIETLENVGRHAYPCEKDDKNKKWWLICSIGQTHKDSDDYMFLAIYDEGRGIPHSFEDSKVFQNRVKKHYPKEYQALILGEDLNSDKTNAIQGLVRNIASRVRSLRKTIGDSGMIYASMMHEMTRIDDESHGQGSVSIKDVITNDPESKLIIFSNKGCYQFNRGHAKEDTIIEYENELSGSLLQWSIKLDELN